LSNSKVIGAEKLSAGSWPAGTFKRSHALQSFLPVVTEQSLLGRTVLGRADDYDRVVQKVDPTKSRTLRLLKRARPCCFSIPRML
jgi:hypothetical protein